MKRIDSTHFVTSKVPGYEEVRYKLVLLTEGRSIELNVKLAPFKAQLREAMAEIESLTPRDEEDKPLPIKDATVRAKIENLHEQTQLVLQQHINPAWVTWGLKAVDNLEVDGEQITTAEAFIQSAPPELFGEVLDLIHKDNGLTPDESGN